MLRSSLDDVRQVSSFAGNQVFRVRVGDDVAFLKLTADEDLRREVAVIEALRARGTPVPIIEAFDPQGDLAGVPSVLLRHVGGRPLTGAEPEFLRAGAHLRAVHDLRIDGFGSLIVRPDGLQGEDRSWLDTLRHRTAGLDPIVAAGLVPAELLDRAAAAVEGGRDLFTAVRSGHLLHGDFHPRHVYAAEGRITGIIDWGDATSGDPVYDLARVFHFGVLDDGPDHGFALVRVVLESYGDAGWTGADLTAKLLLYAVVFVMWSMMGEFSGGAPWAPWWPAQSAALSLVLDELGHR